MKGHYLRRSLGVAAAVCLAGQTALTAAPAHKPVKTADAVESYTDALVANAGSASEAAYIRGGARVSFDDALDSNVLHVGGDSFGAGWLQLPAMFGNVTDKGFTIALDFKLDSDAEDYTRLFQLSSIPFGTGAVPSYSSPDISVDLNKQESFRASIFAGKLSKAPADSRAIFELSAAPDHGKWHKLCVSYSPEGVVYCIDGKAVETAADEKLPGALSALFTDGTIQSYIYNSIGHSTYTDNDIKASVDNVAVYEYALTAAQAASLPKDPAYLFTFEPDTITEASTAAEEKTSTVYGGIKLTSCPALQTSSPDGKLVTKFWVGGNGSYYYTVDKFNGTGYDQIIQPSKLGLVTTTEDLSSGLPRETSVSRYSGDETYTVPNGKHCTIRDHFNEVAFPLVKGESVMTIIMRVYDDGIGYRYALNHSASIKEESSEIIFPEKGTFWGNWPNATYEWEIAEFPMSKITDAWADYSVPFMGNVNDKYWVLVSEANVFNEDTPYAACCLRTTGGSRALGWKGGVKVDGISMPGSFHTPWRAVIIGDTLDQMSGSDLIMNLNPDNVIGDTSWVKPGKVAWSWWSSGGDSPIEYHNQKDYIDFAAKNGWDHVCLDFGWALWDDSAAKVKELCEYGAEKGIGIFLWYGVNNKGHDGYRDSAGHPAYPYYSLLDEETIIREFERVSGLGVKGVKVDYYESDTQETMKQMHWCAEYAAKNHLMVLFHGCTVPRGESRTYPHVISYEAISGTEFYKWFETPSLANRITYTFLRNTIGSADFTSTGIAIPGIAATPGFALADVVNIESGVQHFAHSVYTYEGNGALAFLNDVPVKWDGMKVIDGYPMKFNVTARRSGNDWYVGASTLDSRTITVKLSDLIDDDGIYTAYIFGDNEDGSEIKRTILTGLTRESEIKQDLLKNGGCVMKITRTNMKLDTEYDGYVFYEAENATVSGKAAKTIDANGKYCSGGGFVGYVGGAGNSVSFENVSVPKAGEYKLRIYYISGERRSLQVAVNGVNVTKLDGLYANRNDWKGICAVDTMVKLNEGRNTIKLFNDSGNAPSIDRIAIDIPQEYRLVPYTVIPGDLNYDGVVDSYDAVLMRDAVLQPIADPKVSRAADFNQNGKVEEDDLIALTQFLLGV